MVHVDSRLAFASAVTHPSLPRRGPVRTGGADCCSSSCQQEVPTERRSQPSNFPRCTAAVTWLQIKQLLFSSLDRPACRRREMVYLGTVSTQHRRLRHLSSERQMNPPCWGRNARWWLSLSCTCSRRRRHHAPHPQLSLHSTSLSL